MVTQEGKGGGGPKLKREVVRATAPEKASPGTGDGRPSKENQDPQSRIEELERPLQERPPVQPDPPRST